jgi:hypothetical protein
MMMILSKIPQILGTLVHFFHKNPLYECHWISFGLPMAKIHQNKLLFRQTLLNHCGGNFKKN